MEPESPAAFLLSAGSLSSAQCRQNYDDQRMQLRTGWAFGLMRSHRADVQRDRVEELDTTLLVCEPALAESMHLLARFSKAHDALFGILRNGALTIAFRIDEDISALRRTRNIRTGRCRSPSVSCGWLNAWAPVQCRIAVGNANQGTSVALSGDGNTAIVGGWGDNSRAGAVWVFTRSGGVWSQQGSKLVGTGGVEAAQGWSVALSDDGNTAVVGGPGDHSHAGAVWVFTRSGGAWSQQGSKLVGTSAVGNGHQGSSVALSGDGTTAIVGG